MGINLEYCFGDIGMHLGPKNAFCAKKANFLYFKINLAKIWISCVASP